MKKPLIFRKDTYGGEFAQRNKIEYKIKHSRRVDLEVSEEPFYVTRFDKANDDYIRTERVKRFATSEEAKQYCQDMYDGKIDLSSLRAEIKADTEYRERKRNQIDRDKADKFKVFLSKKGVSLPVFLELLKMWENTDGDSHSLLYSEAEEIRKEKKLLKNKTEKQSAGK